LIDALDTYVIDNLQDANPINSASTFTKYSPPTPEPEPAPEPTPDPIPEEPTV
jgi:hypothetical protein